MICVKCNYGFCWRCFKFWKFNYKDYYNCFVMVSGWVLGGGRRFKGSRMGREGFVFRVVVGIEV